MISGFLWKAYVTGSSVQQHNRNQHPLRVISGGIPKISRPLSKPPAQQQPAPAFTTPPILTPASGEPNPTIFIAGSLAIDLCCDYAPRSSSASPTPENFTSNPSIIRQSLGGVGSNVARAAHLLDIPVRLCSAIGDDLSGQAALKALHGFGMSTAGIKILPQESAIRTAQYIAVNDANKDLVLAMADMSILDCTVISESFDTFWHPQLQSCKPAHLVLDANWPAPYLARWLNAGKQISAHITFEPVSTAKSTRLFSLIDPNALAVYPNPSIHLSTPNSHELSAMHAAARANNFFDREDWWTIIDALGIPSSGITSQITLATSKELVDQGIPQKSLQLLPFVPTICTKLGAQGVLVTSILPTGDPRLISGEYAPFILSRCKNGSEGSLGVGGVYMRLFPPAEVVDAEEVVSVNGVGDTFAGTLVAGLAAKGWDKGGMRVEELVYLAQKAAVLTLKSAESVSPELRGLKGELM